MSPNPQFSTALVTFTEDIIHGKLYFLCSDKNQRYIYIDLLFYLFIFYIFSFFFLLTLLLLLSLLFSVSLVWYLTCIPLHPHAFSI